MPRETPDTAEMTKPTVRTRMMSTATLLVSGPAPDTIVTPVAICMAAMPRAAAVPNSVAMIAKMSTSLPANPSVWRSPKRVRKIEDMRKARPRRYAA